MFPPLLILMTLMDIYLLITSRKARKDFKPRSRKLAVKDTEWGERCVYQFDVSLIVVGLKSAFREMTMGTLLSAADCRTFFSIIR